MNAHFWKVVSLEMEFLEISCEEVRRDLSNYVDEEVTFSLRARIEVHVSGCGGCRAIYDGIRNVIQLIGTGEIWELPEGFSQRLYRRLIGTTMH